MNDNDRLIHLQKSNNNLNSLVVQRDNEIEELRKGKNKQASKIVELERQLILANDYNASIQMANHNMYETIEKQSVEIERLSKENYKNLTNRLDMLKEHKKITSHWLIKIILKFINLK